MEKEISQEEMYLEHLKELKTVDEKIEEEVSHEPHTVVPASPAKIDDEEEELYFNYVKEMAKQHEGK